MITLAIAQLKANNVPTIDGAYHCYLDPFSMQELFVDSMFQRVNIGLTSAAEAIFGNARGIVETSMGCRFIPTTEAYVQTTNGVTIRRPIVCGQGALIEGDFPTGVGAEVPRDLAVTSVVDGIEMITREPLDRLQQIVAQSWEFIGAFTAPTDTTTNPTTIGTATNATYKRAVILEHV